MVGVIVVVEMACFTRFVGFVLVLLLFVCFVSCVAFVWVIGCLCCGGDMRGAHHLRSCRGDDGSRFKRRIVQAVHVLIQY